MGSLSSRLCAACRKFNFKEILSTESAEQDMGPLSDYGHPNCPFCRLIVAAVSRAGWEDFVKLCSCTADKKTPHIFIQSWSPMTVMKNGHIEHPEPRLQLALDQRPDEFQLGRPTLRQLDRGKIRFIIAELESLPDKGEKRFITRHSVGDRVDPALVQGWLRECNEQHSHSKRNRAQAQAVKNSLFQYKDGFLLIDVVDEQLVRKTEPCDYVALSYIWGGVQSFQTTTENIEKLTAGPGSLSASWLESFGGGKIPRTVLDAMEFTRQLGIRHAWVDTLCILQDETQEKARLIGRMDDIYDNAAVTLIAGSGNNSQTGLKGVSVRDAGVPIDPETITQGKKGFNLAICPRSLCEEVRRSAWNTRCWTYQEQCLSQRCLYFTPHEVFFNCSKMQRREAYSAQIPDTGTEEATRYFKLEIRTGPPWWSRNLRKDPDPTPYRYMGDLMANKPSLADYQTAVQDYIRKKLTYQEDIFDAFEGIYNRFCRGDGDRVSIRLAQGIPRQFLWQAMLWFPSHSAKKRVARPDSPEWQAKRFSSWSWASWVGPVDFFFAESLWISRNLSHAIRKGKPVHAAVPCWYYGDSSEPYWSCNAWKDAGTASSGFLPTKTFLENRIGLHTKSMLLRSSLPPGYTSNEGHLGFFAAYLPAGQGLVTMVRKKPEQQAQELKIGPHAGQFRYDTLDPEETAEQFVLLAAGETITRQPDTMAILLGLVTRDGTSKRVGLGYVVLATGSSMGVKWQYRFFHVG